MKFFLNLILIKWNSHRMKFLSNKILVIWNWTMYYVRNFLVKWNLNNIIEWNFLSQFNFQKRQVFQHVGWNTYLAIWQENTYLHVKVLTYLVFWMAMEKLLINPNQITYSVFRQKYFNLILVFLKNKIVSFVSSLPFWLELNCC